MDARREPTGVPAVSMRGITKRFPGVLANDRIDFDAEVGEVHALLGENGAGKTTLCHILTGLSRPDEGRVFLFGEEVSFASPREAIDAGVCMVHQHFRLVGRFTVAENIVLGDRRGAGRRLHLDTRTVERQVRELGERYQLPVDPHAYVWQLSLGEQQRVEVLNALYQDARVLVLDEPTSVLTPNEADTLFATLRAMAAEGRTVIFISHKLHEVKAVSARVTVLRSGRVIATEGTADATRQSLAALMIGRELEVVHRRRREPSPGQPVLAIDDLWVPGDRGDAAVKGVSIEVGASEIVAVAGVSGNGQRELAEAITGLRAPSRGSIGVDGVPLRRGDARAAFDAGVRYVPEDRLETGVSPGLSIAMNLALRNVRQTSFGPFLRLRKLRCDCEVAMRKFDIKASSPDMRAANLSGGNLQKVVIAREFSDSMKVLVAASPTHGLDVAAVEAVHARLVEAAAGGTAILLLSEDLDEILALNDRIVVMYEGRLTEVGERGDIADMGLLMAGETTVAQSSVS